jgi:hypothetical protein
MVLPTPGGPWKSMWCLPAGRTYLKSLARPVLRRPGLGKPLTWIGVHPMPNQTTLSEGRISNHDEITVILVEPTDGTRRSYACIGRYATQQPPPATTLL